MAKGLSATLNGFYRNKQGRLVFRYLVNGDQEELKAYEEAQGANFRKFDDPNDANNKLNGTPLFFSPRVLGKQIELEIGPNKDRVYPKEDVMAVMDKQANFEDKVQNHLAEKEAELLFQRRFRLTTQAPQTTATN